MEFRLIYQGKLLGPTGGNNRTRHKHEIRRVFHPQLKHLWKVSPQLSKNAIAANMVEDDDDLPPHTEEALASRFSCNSYNFVPLVTRDISLYCELDILFLRPDPPGLVLKSGDIDNRMKTLFDALRMPRDTSELGGYNKPEEQETPLYCLLEDDSLITKLTVETDILLSSKLARETQTEDENDQNNAMLVITVRLHPITLTLQNLRFG